MKLDNKKHLFSVTAILLFSLLFLQGCKKSSGSDGASNSTYPFTASVNSNAWTANFVNAGIGGPGIAEVTSSNGLTEVIAVGIQIVNTNDSSIFVVVFPASL